VETVPIFWPTLVRKRVKKALLLHPEDNVVVALDDVPANDEVAVSSGVQLEVLRDVPFGHKIALRTIGRGGAIIKYGVPIAYASAGIAVGEWVHTHNAESYLTAKHEGHTA
jgi:SAF domain